MAAMRLRACECLSPQPEEVDGVVLCRRCGELAPLPGIAQVNKRLADLEERFEQTQQAPQTGPEKRLSIKEAAAEAGLHYETLRANRTDYGFRPGARYVAERVFRTALRRKQEGR